MAILTEGQVVRATCTVERYLGEGAFAEVYRVQHRFLGRQAMKVFKTKGMSIEEIEEMMGEAILLSRIGHPNIVRVYDANILEIQDSTYGFFTMEYVPGGTLDRYWQSYQSKLMPVQEAVDIIKQVCAGLAVGHSENPPIVHRDIKPQNILIGYDGSGIRVRVSDFGLAKRVNPMTLMVSAKGTLSFKPPESLKNQDSCLADIWAIGTTMYLLLTDRLPYPGLDSRDVDDATRFMEELKPANFYNIRVDQFLDEIITRCLAKKPDDRYSNAGELLQALNSWKPIKHHIRSESRQTNSESSKTIFVERSPLNEITISRRIQEAMQLSKLPGKLPMAADILEEIINKDHSLRKQYESQLKLWRKGMVM
ncbi:MAG: serine/threonine-protein kinase [Sedimentisphaerales bacterium]|jgi:serine/threonine-protein kinase